MGIRYYAYPIGADQYQGALHNPCSYHGADPLADAWGPPEESPDMLYLDKCWRELQALLGPSDGRPPRPAFELVRGEVTHLADGWRAFERALSPDEVRMIAEDLAGIAERDVAASAERIKQWCDTPEQSRAYVMHYLAAAKEFTSRLAANGLGLVYLIG